MELSGCRSGFVCPTRRWLGDVIAPMERLFRSLKSEWIPVLGYRNLPEARKDVGGYLMDYYNRQRPHAFNDGISPVAAEENLKVLSGIS